MALAVAAFLQLPAASSYSSSGTPIVLSSEQHELVRDLDLEAHVGSLVIDSYLQNSASLTTGTPVVEVTLETVNGGHHRWLIRVGIESGEWAARRDDVASQIAARRDRIARLQRDLQQLLTDQKSPDAEAVAAPGMLVYGRCRQGR